MAELPDLSVFAGILNKRFKGKTLRKIEIKHSGKLNVSTNELEENLLNHRLVTVARSGKTLQFDFGKDKILGLHLMLRGEVKSINEQEPIPKYTIFAFHFSGGEGFAVTDTLKQATPTLNPAENNVPDALNITRNEFFDLLKRRKKTIKEVLMDQKAIRGIGNSYGDEILWDAKISPFSVSSKIPEAAALRLYKSITKVLNQAIEDITKENGDELTGELRDFLKIHGAHLKLSPTGEKIKSEKIGGRLAYFTDEQELFI